MYTIYADGKPLYHPQLFHEGCGVISPRVNVELSKAGSVEFTLPPSNSLYGEINKLKTIITAFQNGEEIFRGRVLHDDKDFYNQKNTYCEGELAFLLDSVQRPYSFNDDVGKLFRRLIENHNSRVESEKKFTVGTVTVSGKTSFTSTDYPTTFDEINNRIIDVFGGYIQTRNQNGTRYIDLLATPKSGEEPEAISQVIEFGVNLLDISEHITAENVFTVLIPLGETVNDKNENTTDQKLNISSVNGGKDYIQDDAAIALFGRIEKKQEWSDVKEASELLSLAIEFLKKNIEMSVSLTLSAIDLNLLNVNASMIRLGDWVRVISLPHGLDKKFQCTKITYNLENPDQNQYSFGLNYKTLTEQQVSNTKAMNSSVSTVLSTAGVVNSSAGKANAAYEQMENVIAQMPTDYISQSVFDAYKAEVNSKFEEINTKYEQLLRRIIDLEGGTV